MNDYISKAVKRYASLFTLPSQRTLLIWLFLTCLFNGILIVTALQSLSNYWLGLGLTPGVALFILTIVSDYVFHLSRGEREPILNMRRCFALSFYSLLVWLFFIFLSAITNLFYAGFWFKFFILGFCSALVLRLLVLSAVSFAGAGRVAVYAVLLPVLYTIPVVSFASVIGAFRLDISLVIFTFLSVAVAVTAAFLYIFFINRIGVEILGVDSFSVLKAFMANWTEDQNAPLENLFDRFGQARDIRVSALSFRNTKGMVKAMMVVPAFHPGPFKNVGSSALPHAIQTTLENKLKNCVVSVPHGLSGHDLDLATQAQNQFVLDKSLTFSGISDFRSFATPFDHVEKNGANVGCQVFNGCALVTLTLAPETMEDLPLELNTFIVEEAEKYGFSTAIAIDAHDSIQGPFKINEAIKPLQEAAVESLQKASKHRSPLTFQVGASRVRPKEFGLREGMGPSGIAALVVRVGSQTTAYVTIDGNNMISGLREKILSALLEIGVNGGEVFTTDTHAVNAVVLNARGYHPIGEVMDQEQLIENVKRAVAAAVNNLEPAEAGWKTETVPNVKVIGQKQIESMCMLAEKAAIQAKRLALLMFPIVGILIGALMILF